MKKLLLLLCAFMASISGAWAQTNLASGKAVSVIYLPGETVAPSTADLAKVTDGNTGTNVMLPNVGNDIAAISIDLTDANKSTRIKFISVIQDGRHATVYKIYGTNTAPTTYATREALNTAASTWTELVNCTNDANPGGDDAIYTKYYNIAENSGFQYIVFVPTAHAYGVSLRQIVVTSYYSQTLTTFEPTSGLYIYNAAQNVSLSLIDQYGFPYIGDVTSITFANATYGYATNVSGPDFTFGADFPQNVDDLQISAGGNTIAKGFGFLNNTPALSDVPAIDDGASYVIFSAEKNEKHDVYNTYYGDNTSVIEDFTIDGKTATRIKTMNYVGYQNKTLSSATDMTGLVLDIFVTENHAKENCHVNVEKNGTEDFPADLNKGWNHIVIPAFTTAKYPSINTNETLFIQIDDAATENVVIYNVYYTKVAVPTTSISVVSPATEVAVSKTLQLTVKNQVESILDASNITFESSNSSVATVDVSGVVTGVAEGEVTITAKLKEDNTIQNTINLTVTPKPLGQEFVNGTHSIFVLAFHDVGTNNYELIITSEEQMEGMGGSFWTVNGVGADMRETLVISGDKKTMTIVVESTSAPNIYTPLHILMPGEISFSPVTLEWIERVKDGLYVDVESTTATVIGTIAAGDITNLKTAAGDASIVDVSRATISSSTVALEAINPNAVVIATAAQKTSLTGTKNLVIKDGSTYTADVITYTDQPGTVPANLAITTGEVSYTRTGMAVGKLFSVVLPFSAVIPANFKAYQVKAYDGSKMTFAEISGTTLSAGTAYVIKSETTNDFVASMTSTTLDFEEETSTTAGVTTTANLTQILDNTGDKYVLSDNKIKKLVGTAKVAAFRGYFTFTSAGSNVIDFNLEGDVTGIENLKSDNLDNAVFYDLNGHRVANPTKGLYIVNGKKVILK